MKADELSIFYFNYAGDRFDHCLNPLDYSPIEEKNKEGLNNYERSLMSLSKTTLDQVFSL